MKDERFDVRVFIDTLSHIILCGASSVLRKSRLSSNCCTKYCRMTLAFSGVR